MPLPFPRRLPTIEIHDVKDRCECEWAIEELYELIERTYGEMETRRMFAHYGRDHTAKQINERKNFNWLLSTS